MCESMVQLCCLLFDVWQISFRIFKDMIHDSWIEPGHRPKCYWVTYQFLGRRSKGVYPFVPHFFQMSTLDPVPRPNRPWYFVTMRPARKRDWAPSRRRLAEHGLALCCCPQWPQASPCKNADPHLNLFWHSLLCYVQLSSSNTVSQNSQSLSQLTGPLAT